MQAVQGARAFGRLSLALLATLLCIPLYRLSPFVSTQRQIARLWFCAVRAIAGLQNTVSGRIQHQGPVLYVANHVSYLDIILLGASLNAVFVSKSDVADWPLFGRIARMGQCVFVSRKPTQVRAEAAVIHRLLASGRNVILFPEGTTGCGGGLLPFKSALLAALDGLPHAQVQPVSIAYPDRLRGGADISLAWYGDMALMPHLWQVLKRADAPSRLHFLPALRAGDFSDRKHLAASCQTRIQHALAHSLAAEPGDSAVQTLNWTPAHP